jgi:hypothetical protein
MEIDPRVERSPPSFPVPAGSRYACHQPNLNLYEERHCHVRVCITRNPSAMKAGALFLPTTTTVVKKEGWENHENSMKERHSYPGRLWKN